MPIGEIGDIGEIGGSNFNGDDDDKKDPSVNAAVDLGGGGKVRGGRLGPSSARGKVSCTLRCCC